MRIVAQLSFLALSLAVLSGPFDAFAQIDELPHPDTTAGNFFGVAVSLDGARALVGASGEHSCEEDAGAAYLFEQDARTRRWHRVARLTAGDCEERRFFGRSVALSGGRALVAATNKEGVAKGPDRVYVFERDSLGKWLQAATLMAHAAFPDATTGTEVSLESDVAVLSTWGDTADGRYAGAAYVFEFDSTSGVWKQQARLTGSRNLRQGILGGTTALDESTLAVPSSRYHEKGSGSVYLFQRSEGGAWQESARLDGADAFFIAVAVDGDQLLVGKSRSGGGNSGIATVYTRGEDGQWLEQSELAPPTPYRHGAFGSKVALSGDRALVVGYDEQLQLNINIDRVVYVYALDTETSHWAYANIIDIGRVAFASAIDLDGRYALIGAAAEDSPGAAYIIRIP